MQLQEELRALVSENLSVKRKKTHLLTGWVNIAMNTVMAAHTASRSGNGCEE